MSNNIKVAVIGAGMMGKNHLKTYKNLQGVELVGVYDIFPEAAKAAADMFGIKAFSSMDEVAKNVDAVSVVTTSVTHAEVGSFFLNRGIHCLIEKPLATTEDECQMLIKTAKDNNVTLLVGHIERFNPAVEQMGKILSDTSKIRSLTAQRMSAASGRITDVDVSMDLMIHDIEVIQSLVKSPVVNVHAFQYEKGTYEIYMDNGAYAILGVVPAGVKLNARQAGLAGDTLDMLDWMYED